MKKLMLCFIIFVMAFQLFGTYVVAAENEDSVNISEQERMDMQDHPDDIIVKLYGTAFMYLFAEEKPVSKMLNQEYAHGYDWTYMVISATSGQVKYKHYYDGKVYEIDRSSMRADWDEMYPYAEDPSKVLGKSVTVTNIYCLNGDPSYDGAYIYYVTDQGDYVLYKEYLGADDMYLFPVEDFYAFAKAVHEERLSSSKGPNGEYFYGGGKSVAEIYNVKPYKIADHSWVIWVVALFAVSSIIAFVIIKRRKTVRNEQVTEITE